MHGDLKNLGVLLAQPARSAYPVKFSPFPLTVNPTGITGVSTGEER